ncbi:MAG: hypothetical protein INF90_10140 [Roseomonas sp.]|nr:hypothetical protein [Roseomonas sp.]
MSDAQKLTEREAEVLWAIRGFFESNRYKTDLNFVEVLEACPENIVAGILRPILEHLQTLRFLRQDADGLFSLTPLGLGLTDKRAALAKDSFTAFCDLLLVALADHTGRQGTKFDAFDLRAVAELYALDFTQGWIERASEVFEKRGWATVSRVLGFGKDRGFHATLIGDGLLKAEELKNEFIKSGVTPPSYPPPDSSLSVKTQTVPSAGTTPIFIGGDPALEAQGNLGSIPASDRFVVIDHNSKSYRETSESIEKVRTAVTQANDLFATEGEKLEVLSELSNLQKLFSGETLRIGALKQYTEGSGTLPYLYQKAKDGIVGSAAWECLQKIVKFIAECLDFS